MGLTIMVILVLIAVGTVTEDVLEDRRRLRIRRAMERAAVQYTGGRS
jgi:hypothetical protein